MRQRLTLEPYLELCFGVSTTPSCSPPSIAWSIFPVYVSFLEIVSGREAWKPIQIHTNYVLCLIFLELNHIQLQI